MSGKILDADVTALLDAWNRGEPGALDRVVEAVYPELHGIAARLFHGERPGHTLQPTAVVNELYLKLHNQLQVNWRNRAHLFGVAAGLIRRLLVDYARRHATLSRGGGQIHLSLDAIREAVAPEVGRLDHVLVELKRRSARQCRIVEMRAFVGLGFDEIAELEKVSRATISRDWKTARLFLLSQLQATAE